MALKATPMEDKFWPKVRRTDGCWEWIGARYRNGYGFINIRKPGKATTKGAHRISWEIHNGPIPDGLVVCHRCDNPPCVNPLHLFLGTATENMRDMSAKGRALFGDKNPTRKHPECVSRGESHRPAKLLSGDVICIRRMSEYGITQNVIAKKFNVTQSNVSAIIRRKSWNHLKEPA